MPSRDHPADIEMTAVPACVCSSATRASRRREADLDRATTTLGNSLKELNETHFIPMFIGYFWGLCWLHADCFSAPATCALVCGVHSLLPCARALEGRRCVPHAVNANLAFREFGIALFFAAVGLDAARSFLTLS